MQCCVVARGCVRWGGSWALLSSALATAVQSCRVGSDVMYNGSPLGRRDGEGGGTGGKGAETRSLPCARAVLRCSDCGRGLMWSHLLHARRTSDTAAQTEGDWVYSVIPLHFTIWQVAAKQKRMYCARLRVRTRVSAACASGGSTGKEGRRLTVMVT